MELLIRLTIFFYISVVTINSYLSPAKNISFTLAPNIIVNPNITTPVISPQKYIDYSLTQGGWSTTGIYVEYLDVCLYKTNFYACPSYAGTTCGNQFINTDSQQNNQNLYQSFQMPVGNQYQLKFSWISQISFIQMSTGVSVLWNGVVVDSFYSSACTLYTSTYYLISKNGTNTISFQGIGMADGFGILIRNVNLQQLIYANITTNSTTSPTSNTTNSTTSPTTNTTTNSTSNTTSTGLNSTNSTYNSNTTNSTNSTVDTTNSSTANPPNGTVNPANSTLNLNVSLNLSNLVNNLSIPNLTSNIVIPSLPIFNPILNGNSTNINQFTNYSTLSDLQKYFNGSQFKKILKFVQFIYKNKVAQLATNLNSLKQSAKFAMGLMLEFNHFLLYSYHLLNYTITSDMILVGMQMADEQKGQFLDQYIYPYLSTSPQEIFGQFQQQNSLPFNTNNFNSNFHFRPSCFFLDFTDTMLMSIPIIIFISTFGYILFRILFKFRISQIFRPNSILGIFFCIILDGKLELLTFYFLSEILLLTTSSFSHKLKTSLIIFIYFLCFLFAVSSMLIYRWIYRKLLKYIYDNCKRPLQSSFYMTFSYGLYNVILGTLHRLLLPFPLYQIYALIAFEAIYLIYLASLVFRSFFHNTFKAFTLCMMNSARLAFITTLLLYEMEIGQYYTLSKAQEYIFYTFIGFWGLTIAICLLQKVILILKIIVTQYKKRRINKVAPLKNEYIRDPQQKKMTQKVFIILKDKKNKTRIKIHEEVQNIEQKCQMDQNKTILYQNQKREGLKNYFTFRKRKLHTSKTIKHMTK